MTEVEYAALTAACDALLRDHATTPEKVGVTWLHVLSEHPNNLVRYQEVFDRPGRLARARKYLWHSAGNAEKLLRSLYSPGTDPAADSAGFPPQVDILLLSHLVSARVRSEAADFYYGRLPEELAARGLTSLVALQNHVADGRRSLRDRLTRGGKTSRILLPLATTFSHEIRMYRRARAVASVLRRDASAAQTAFQRSVALEAARHAATRSTIGALRLHDAVMRLCTRFKPRALMVTWEGHAWERLAFRAARTVDPNVRCIGYQHTILFPHTHALRMSLGKSYDPDVILTVGEVNRDALKASPSLRGLPILTYGSHRRGAGVHQRRADDAAKRCLVIPEGIESECLALFDFALTAAAFLPDLQFVLRTHPVLPFDRLARRHARLRALPLNVRLSNNADIAVDFAQCDWALYRGSSAAVYAVLAGVRPVYVKRFQELPIDPLFALREWRRHVATSEELGALVAADRVATSEARLQEWESARAFCERYAVAPNPDIVQGFLKDECPLPDRRSVST